ncbi:DUF6286 domain-containing Asp23/Gls24 family envelope stress response protein [Streptomyces sp. NPDC002104]
MTARDRGTTTVAGRVVRKIAEQSARETLTALGGRVSNTTATVRGRSADVGVGVVLAYRGSASDTAQAVQDHVAARTSHLTGLHIQAPRIRVRELAAPARSPVANETPVVDGPGPARAWSERRLPVAFLAALASGGAAVLLRDAAWQARLVDWLARHGPATTPFWAATALGTAGLWMVVLALTPGRRGDLTMSGSGTEVRAVISRRSASRHVRAALARLPDIAEVRVRVGRRRVTVRALFTRGEKAGALGGVHEAVEAAVRDLALAPPPRIRVRLRPDPSWQAARTPRAEGDEGDAGDAGKEEEADGPHA